MSDSLATTLAPLVEEIRDFAPSSKFVTRKILEAAATSIEDVATVDTIPLFKAVRHGKKHLRFWCPYCQCNHVHGLVGEMPIHRSAHCHVDTSPLIDGGYFLMLDE